ncbi:MAG: PEGA domain-containing protein [Deltaproteobacteria bacterium]|nr:PEGA domain-containing protein [Deltaproteobacteria bacterium]
MNNTQPQRNRTGAAYPTIFSLFLLLSACAAPLEINTRIDKASLHDKALVSAPVTVYIQPFIDNRDQSKSPFKDPRTIGRVNVPISDMIGDSLTLSEDIPVIVTSAFANGLIAAGYAIAQEEKDADFMISGTVEEFSLNLDARDALNIGLSGRIVERETNRVIWAGVETEKTDRYAGVMGNSRATITKYIASSLYKLVNNVLVKATPMIENTRAVYRPNIDKENTAIPASTGRAVVLAEPVRSKVYINDVYYGLTPLKLDIAPGVYEITVKHRGFKDAMENISVRQGQITEMEVVLEKE